MTNKVKKQNYYDIYFENIIHSTRQQYDIYNQYVVDNYKYKVLADPTGITWGSFNDDEKLEATFLWLEDECIGEFATSQYCFYFTNKEDALKFKMIFF